MDNLRSNLGSAGLGDDERDYDYADDDATRELPPMAIGTDERRMQVRAYNHWASQLEDRTFPSIEDLDPDTLTDFGPFSVLLDFTAGIKDPAIPFLGENLARECGTDRNINTLDQVPSRSLLSRITDHYMQILANQAPIGFEAEFINQRDVTILYRGILLPYSSDGETIDFIYGVINWKEIVDQITTDELLVEIDRSLHTASPRQNPDEPVTDWADGPASGTEPADSRESDDTHGEQPETPENDNTMDNTPVISRMASLIQPRTSSISGLNVHQTVKDNSPDLNSSNLSGNSPVASVSERSEQMEKSASEDGPAMPDRASSLVHCLADARALAQTASTAEDRTRAALYAAVSRAYDVCLAAQQAPEELALLAQENGLTIQDRAPMTPIVKLVFGSDYDKTRLTEYASVLSHAQRIGIVSGGLQEFLSGATGGLKGVVSAERRLRKEASGKIVEPAGQPREKIAKKLRSLDAQPIASINPQGAEFGVVMIRRLTTGDIMVVGEVSDDTALVEKVARKLV